MVLFMVALTLILGWMERSPSRCGCGSEARE